VKLKIDHSKDSITDPNQAVYALYQRYGSLLLGYITEVVEDKNLAEQYLITVFKEVLARADEFNRADRCWINLQRLAKKVLLGFHRSVRMGNYTGKASATANNYVMLMGQEQYQVFYGIHYQQKSVTVLAKELNKTEESIKQLLRAALTIIRNEQKR
jgi:hypothetical protein